MRNPLFSRLPSSNRPRDKLVTYYLWCYDKRVQEMTMKEEEKRMNGMMSREQVQQIREQYPPGTRIRLNYMEDAHAVPAGTEGTVVAVDDAGQIHMDWDNGRTLALIPGEDSFSAIQQKQGMTMQMGGM